MKHSNWYLKGLILLVSLSLLLLTCQQKPQEATEGEAYYQPNWESLSKWTVPVWFDQAVLGIYCHWGVYSVPGYRFNDGAEQVDSGLWYGWFMYVPNDSGEENYGVHDFHKKTYGDPSEFGYHDLVPLFKAENWNPDEWAELYKYSGADFAGIAAEHGDGFVLWDTELDKFNVGDMGPKRDLLGDLFEAVRKQGMKTVATFHERPGWMFDAARKYYPDAEGINDPDYADLYGETLFEVQNKKLLEVVDRYRPDQVWFEDEYCGEANWKEFIAYYYNSAREWDKEVFISQKHEMAPLSASIFDVEGGIFPDGVWEWAGMEEPQEQRWQKDVPIGNYWAYAEGVGCRPINLLVDGIVDRVSKNGVTLLDVAPKADGTLPQAQIDGLKALGDWMAINKDALYAAKPAHFVEGGIDEWRSGTIRFLEKGDFLYAIELGNDWPPEVGFAEYGGSIEPQAPYTIPGVSPVEGSEVLLMGHNDPLPWHMEGEDLIIDELPKPLPCEHAWAFKIRKSE